MEDAGGQSKVIQGAGRGTRGHPRAEKPARARGSHTGLLWNPGTSGLCCATAVCEMRPPEVVAEVLVRNRHKVVKDLRAGKGRDQS